MMEMGATPAPTSPASDFWATPMKWPEAAARTSAAIYSRRLPLLPGALEFAEMGIIPAGAYRNLRLCRSPA